MGKTADHTLRDFDAILDEEMKNDNFKALFDKESSKLDMADAVRELKKEQNLSQ